MGRYVVLLGSRRTTVEEWFHRDGGCQGHRRRCHVGSGKHKCAPHGTKIIGTDQYRAFNYAFSQLFNNTITIGLIGPSLIISGTTWILWRNHFWAFWTGLYDSVHENWHMNLIPPTLCYLLSWSLYNISLPTDFERPGDGVKDAHPLFGCGHHTNALWEMNRSLFE